MKKIKCVKCGNTKNMGGWISVNVYDHVVGRHMGVECGRKDCVVKNGTPAEHKLYWQKHFLKVALRPDYFADFVTKEFWEEIESLFIIDRDRERVTELRRMIEKQFGRKTKKWWQFWKSV